MKLFVISVDTEQDPYEDHRYPERVYMGSRAGVAKLVYQMSREIGSEGLVSYSEVVEPQLFVEDVEPYSASRMGALEH